MNLSINKTLVILFLFLCFSIDGISQNTNYKLWESKFNKGMEFVKVDSLKSALPYLDEAYKIAQDIFTSNENERGNSAYQLALINQKLRKYDKAISLFSEASEIAKVNKNDSLYIERLSELGVSYRLNRNLDDAEKTFKKVLDEIENRLGKNTLEFNDNLIELSLVYRAKEEYKQSNLAIEEANTIIESLYGIDDIHYINNLSSLCRVYVEIGKYEEAFSIQKNVYEYFKSIDSENKDFAYACFNMSYMYHYLNDYEKEIEFMNKAIAIYGEGHSHYSTFINNIGMAYQKLGNHESALSYLLNAVKRTENKTDEGYATRLQNLAFTYVALGEYDKAKVYYKESLGLWENFNKSHKKYGQLINNIGKLHLQIGEYDKAKQLFKEALDNFLENFDVNHTRYGYLLNDYASTLLVLGEEDEAIKLMKENLQIAIDNGKVNTEDFYGRQFSLAKAYNKAGLYQEAIPLLESSVTNIPKILGNDHPKVGFMLKSLSDSYIGLGNIDRAIPLIKESNTILINQIDQIFKFRSEKEKQSYLKMLANNFDNLQALPIKHQGDFDELSAINLNNQLMLKGLLLNNSKNILRQLLSLNDIEIENKVADYKKNKRLLAKVLTQAILDREIDTDSLKSTINKKEAALVKTYSSHFGKDVSLVKNWKSTQRLLKRKDVAIDFAYFKMPIKDQSKGNIMYVAYVFDNTCEFPKMIPLFEEQELKQILAQYKSPNELYKDSKLYELIWKPLTSYIKKKETIYYSPSGLLNQLSFSAIPIDDVVLINKFNLVQLSSTIVLTSNQTEPNMSSALFIGGINYEYEKLSESQQTKTSDIAFSFIENVNFKNSRGTKSRGESWTYLPGTLNEIEDLKFKFETIDNSSITLKGNEATETNFKKLGGNSPNILHIATHGYFYENLNLKSQYSINLSTEDQYRLAEDPLLRSGLILAGANYAWRNGGNPNEEDDGILTALEISNLDLSNTNMVVLSACETGLGDINGSEGVYGLQRAFKMAGVDIIVMSLWQVPDIETSEFMNLFYGNWLQNQNVKLAFNKAQRDMYKKYKSEPLKWGAFVLFE